MADTPSFRSVLSRYIRRDVSQPEGRYLSILISTSGGNSALLASFVYTLGLLADRIGFRYPTDADADCGFGLAHRGRFNLQMPIRGLTD